MMELAMTNPTAPLLSESEVSEIEALHNLVETAFTSHKEISDLIAKVPVLIRDWKVLKAENAEYAETVTARTERLREVVRLNAALREQLAENARNHFDDARDLEARLAQAIRERDKARRQRRELGGDMLGGL